MNCRRIEPRSLAWKARMITTTLTVRVGYRYKFLNKYNINCRKRLGPLRSILAFRLVMLEHVSGSRSARTSTLKTRLKLPNPSVRLFAGMPPIRGKRPESSSANRKKNHVSAEKRRREAIRRGFDQITAIVPNLTSSQSRSEAIVLYETLKLLRLLRNENRLLRELAEASQLRLPDPL